MIFDELFKGEVSLPLSPNEDTEGSPLHSISSVNVQMASHGNT